ncbi:MULTISPECIES: hypothetical protein [unclassified Fusobacterium]|uniref:hypothetical protein n=1 Tax=unclassified Fusobacterium TaxID=2648384 RepID=UPI001B8C98B1|nr:MULTISPECIES: hypothetical protein [unclassified Fusobacterium]MBR8702081.1 hypothetical protein [Fusobacterium sp. DD45]MBR8711883.1 hypothetical protein [Fusobacterium sp. DD28]MBR8752464.1 hypothetical protein [Fusobacterium sp. DD26]
MLNSTIYIICTPQYVPVIAFTSERKAKEYMLDQMLQKGVEYILEYVNLEIDEIFLKRMDILRNTINLSKKKKEDK